MSVERLSTCVKDKEYQSRNVSPPKEFPNKQRLRILAISTSFYPKMDGFIRAVDNQCKVLHEAGHSVYLLTGEKKRNHDDTQHRFATTRVRINGRRGTRVLSYPSLALRFYLEAKDIIVRENIQLTYAYGLLPGFCSLLIKLRKKTPFVLALTDLSSLVPHPGQAENTRMRIARAAVRILLTRADVVVFPTSYAGAKLESSLRVKITRPTIVVPDGVDARRFAASCEDRETHTVLYVGNLRRRKGLEDIVQASKAVIRGIPTAKFVLVGEGVSRRELEESISRNALTPNFELPGRVTEEQLTRFYSEADVYVVPTRFDAYPTSILEAMAAGKPVITTRGSVADLEGIVVPGFTGLLVPIGDIDSLSASITALLSDRVKSRAMGERGREIVVRNHDVAIVEERIERALEMAIGGKGLR